MPPHPRNVQYLRQHLLTLSPSGESEGFRQFTPSARSTPGKRIFLARSSAGTRLIVNAEEFNAMLRDEGFISADMADLTIAQQRELLSDAEILIGTMGTNLLALYFAPKSCTVIGIIDDPGNDPLIAPTAGILGMGCEYFIARSAGASVTALHDRDTDFHVDCDAFRARLREIERRGEL